MKENIKLIIKCIIIIVIIFTILWVCKRLDNNNKEMAPLNLDEIKKFQTRHNIDIDYYSYYDDGYYETNVGDSGYRNASFDIGGYLEEILDYAVKNYDFDIKVASKLQKYKIETVKTKIKDSETNFWTYEEFTKFIKKVDDDFYYTLFNFLYYIGLRYGEMNALTWRDIDFERKELTINKSLIVKIEGGGYAITTPKTQNSNRIIDLSDKIVMLLKSHLEYEKKYTNLIKICSCLAIFAL